MTSTQCAFRLPFDCGVLRSLSAKYTYEHADSLADILPAVQARGYLTRDELLRIGEWKTPRKRSSREKNTSEYVRVVTEAAFGSTSERFRIEALTLLHGIKWPTASVILHFAKDPAYPILDVRALWSIGCGAGPHKYDFPLWWKYVEFCQAEAAKCGSSVRELDRALWQYSKENQGPLDGGVTSR